MDRFLNSNIEQQSIYEIYRACRLCGAGAGYKMPIIQNVVDLDGREVELKQKIQECVQIEVQQNDKMPPLICELCVDKVNDFYEFLEMCRQTNKRTRLRLGLPPQRMPNGVPDAGDCILGVTEPVFINEDSNEPISKHSSKSYKGKSKGAIKVKIQLPESKRESRSRRSSPPSFRRTTRGSASNTQVTSSKHKAHSQMNSSEHQAKSSAPLKSILKKGKPIKVEEDSLLIPRSKRSRERETSIKESQPKRVKIELKPAPKTQLKSAKSSHRPASKQAMHYPCGVCGKSFNSGTSLSNHSRIHSTLNRHKQTMASRRTPPKKPRDVRKEMVPKTSYKFAICGECGAVITRKNIRRHESVCRERNAIFKDVIVDPEVKSKLREVQVRVARCDALLTAEESCTAFNIPPEYGLDTACVYPYISSVRSLRIKTEPDADGMVSIDDRIREAFGTDQVFAHWDSDYSSDDDVSFVDGTLVKKRRVYSLNALTLKTIFSPKCLGKVPRRHRRVKTENLPDHDTGTTNLIESFEDLDELEQINDKVASFDDLLLNGDNLDDQLDPADADDDVIEDLGSGDRVAEESSETDITRSEDRTEEIDNHGTDGRVKVNNEPALESRRISDSERSNKEDSRSYIDNLEENVNVPTSKILLGIRVEDNLLSDKDSRSEDGDTGNDANEGSIRNLQLIPETVGSRKSYDLVDKQEAKGVMSSEVNGQCNANVHLLNLKNLSKNIPENVDGKEKETNIDRSNEEIDRSNREGEEAKETCSEEIEESVDGDHENNDEANVKNSCKDSGRVENSDEVHTEDGDGRGECGEVTGNGDEFQHGGERKDASASVKVGNSMRRHTMVYKLNVDNVQDVSKLMEELDAQLGEEGSGRASEKDKITLEDLLPKAHDIKPIDMDMLTDQFSFDA